MFSFCNALIIAIIAILIIGGGAGVKPIGEGGQVSVPDREAERDLAAGIFHDGFIEPLPILAARLDQLRGVLMGKREVQTKAPCLIEIFGNRRGNKALELVNVEIEGFGISPINIAVVKSSYRFKVWQSPPQVENLLISATMTALWRQRKK